MQPQKELVLNLLKRGRTLTRLVAMHYGVANLTARIADLRNDGYDIRCVWKRDCNKRRYGEWTLVKDAKKAAPKVEAWEPKVGDRVVLRRLDSGSAWCIPFSSLGVVGDLVGINEGFKAAGDPGFYEVRVLGETWNAPRDMLVKA